MKTKRLLIVAVFALGICLAAMPGGATVVTSLPGGTIIPIPAVNYFGGGPQSFGPGITWTSTTEESFFGWPGGIGFLGNGTWTGGLGPAASVGDSTKDFGSTDTMTFAFDTPVRAVGGFLNYNPSGTTPTTIAAYDASNILIESFPLTFTTGGGTNTGSFYGFQEATANIKYFKLTDNYITIANLTTSAVPIPGAVWLLGSGLVGLAGLRRKFNL